MASTFNAELSNHELLEGQSHILYQVFSFVNSMSLKCATELGIPDIIHKHGRPMTLDELVGALQIQNAKADGIYRLMRILTHSGFFSLVKIQSNHEEEEDGYFLTASSRLLVETHPFSFKKFVISQLHPILTEPWQHLSKWFHNDDHVAFVTAHGMSLWEIKVQEPSFSLAFDEGMANDTPLLIGKIVNDCRQVFEGLDSLVDVGGGSGTLAKAIADAFPTIDCSVLDLPNVVADLHGTHNLKYVGGNMFEHIPPANAILMKFILHDWDDEKSVEILKKCKEAITSKGDGGSGKVIIIEMVMDQETTSLKSAETQLFSDMLMMTYLRGKERSEKEWAKLFFDAGFTNYKRTPISGVRSIIEVYA